jgi:hypothetical protein
MSVSDPYIPNLNGAQPASPSLANPQIINGHGAPANTLGDNGDLYYDLDSTLLYGKASGAWGVASGSTTVSGGGGTVRGVVDPEGVVTAVAGTVYWNSALQKFWVKDAGTGNTGWVLLL